MSEFAKRVRRGLKEPLQGALARLAVAGLDMRPRRIAEIRALEPGAIVVSRTDRIGDLLVSSVMVDALRRRWPAARLVIIGGPRNRSALVGLPFAEAGPVFERDPRTWPALRRWLRQQRFDLAMSLQAESVAGAMIAAWSRAAVRMATHDSKVGGAFNFLFGPEIRHHVTRFCEAAAMIGAPCREPRPVFVIPETVREKARVTAGAWRTGGRRVVGIQMPNRSSPRHAARAWPAERLTALAAGLAGAGHQVMLFGFGPELEEAGRIANAVPQARIAPALPLLEAAALLGALDVFVSGYTGMYHLADAAGAATVLIGSEHYAEYWRALGARHRYALAATAAGVTVEAARAAVDQLLACAAGSA